MNMKTTFPNKTNKKRTKGFTLVEVIVVIVIIAILAAILIPSLTRYIDMSREKTDLGQLGLLNRVTQAYRIETSSADPFIVKANNSDILMGLLISDKFLSQPLEAKLPGAEFKWSHGDEQWVYIKADKTVTTLILSGEKLEDYRKTGTWELTNNGFGSAEGLLFIPNNEDYYTITSKATLGSTNNHQGGYGILFETTLNPENKDTGYILQFDRGYEGGEIIIRKRTSGLEGNPIIRIKDNPSASGIERHYSEVPKSKRATWWTESHEVTIDVSSSDKLGKKSLSVVIDGVKVIESFDIDANTEAGDKFTGFRSWHARTDYKSITIE